MEDNTPSWIWITFGAAYLFFVTMKSGKAFDGGVNSTILIHSIWGAIAGYRAYKKRRWELLLGLGFCAVLFVCGVYFLILKNPPTTRILGLLGCAWVMWDIWREFRRTEESDESDTSQEPDPPMISLVLLLKEPQHLDATILAKVASIAWDVEVKTIDESDDDDSDVSFVGGE